MSDRLEELRRIARRKGIKNKDIARKLGVSENSVSRWFKGFYSPSFKHLEELEEILGVSPSENEAQGNKNLVFSDIIDSEMEYQYNKHGVLRIWLDGDLVWETSDKKLFDYHPQVRRTCRLSGGGVGKYIAEALAKGLSVIQDGKGCPECESELA